MSWTTLFVPTTYVRVLQCGCHCHWIASIHSSHVGKLPKTFANALTMEKPLAPIDLELVKHHVVYIKDFGIVLNRSEALL